jgi:hypothetical protein
MFKPNFKIGTFAPPQPPSSTSVAPPQPPSSTSAAIGTETHAPTSNPAVNTTVGSSDGGPTSSLPNEMNSKVAAALPASAKDDDEIAEEVEYDEVSRYLYALC